MHSAARALVISKIASLRAHARTLQHRYLSPSHAHALTHTRTMLFGRVSFWPITVSLLWEAENWIKYLVDHSSFLFVSRSLSRRVPSITTPLLPLLTDVDFAAFRSRFVVVRADCRRSATFSIFADSPLFCESDVRTSLSVNSYRKYTRQWLDIRWS